MSTAREVVWERHPCREDAATNAAQSVTAGRPSIDGFERRRLRAILRRHAHQEGRQGRSQQDDRR